MVIILWQKRNWEIKKLEEKLKEEEKLKKPVTLEIIKKTKEIDHLALIKQSRLSVMPIDYKSWKIIYNMGKV